jgi:hypothetical protein
MDYKERIAHLKQLTLAKNADFPAAVDYFLTIAEDVSMLRYGALLENEKQQAFFKELLSPVAEYYGEDVFVKKLYLMSIKDCCFIHGLALLSNGFDIGLYFFDTDKTGIAFSGYFAKGHEFFRLTTLDTSSSPRPLPSDTMIFVDTSNTYH